MKNEHIEESKQVVPERQSLKKIHISPRGVIAVIIAVLILGLLLGVLELTKKHETKKQGVCGSSILASAIPFLSPVNIIKPATISDFKILSDKIVATKDFQTDPNCLVIVTMYSIQVSNSAEARKNYDQLTAVFDSQKGYAPEIKAVALTPDNIRPVVEFLEKQSQSVLKGDGGQYGGVFGDKKRE